MPIGPGPGKYSDLATVARITSRSRAVVLLLLDGAEGSGFTVQVEPGPKGLEVRALLPGLLRAIADEIESHLEKKARLPGS